MSVRDYSLNALVIRELPLGDNDKLLTLLSEEAGRFNVIAKGAKSLKNPVMPACRAFVWANYEIHESSADSRWLRSASVIEPFTGLCADIGRLYLAQYIADVCMELSGPGEPAGDILRLALNSYFALTRDIRPEAQIKAVFEWRAAACSGYSPELSRCRVCGAERAEAFYLDVMNGGLICASCAGSGPAAAAEGEVPTDAFGTRTVYLPLRGQVPAALRYILEVPMKSMLSFELRDPDDLSDLAGICETYLLSHLGTGFNSLKYYHEVSQL
jgi:DNA repair protein RecO (recombination protein O)